MSQNHELRLICHLLASLTTSALYEVFRPKVLGSWLLQILLRDTPLDFFVSFSSGASLVGSATQGNYAVAGEFLDVLASYQRLFRRVSVEEVESAFRQIFLSLLNEEKKQRGEDAVSIDGKVQKGRLAFEEKNGYPIHAVSVVDHQTGIVLTQGHVQKNDIQSKNEATESEPIWCPTMSSQKRASF